MKQIKYIKIGMLALSFCSILACSDLVQEPVGLLTPNTAFSTVGEVEKGVFGSYSNLASERLWGRQYTMSVLLRGDMCDIGELNTSGFRIEINEMNITPYNDVVSSFWPQAYLVISAANTAIFGGENLKNDAGEKLIDVEPKTINPLIAEAKFNKAFMYYHLVRCFGGLPYVDAFVDDPATVATISKTPENEVYENIITDLKYAKEWLPEKRVPDVRSRPSKGTAAAYLASVYLTLGRYQEAYDEAKYVIENKALFGYELTEDFQDLWDGPNANGLKEHLFAIDFLANYGNEPVNVDFIPALTGVRNADPVGWSICVPSEKVYQTWDNRDYRKVVSFDTVANLPIVGGSYLIQPYSAFTTVPRPHIAKYIRNGGGALGDSENNYADMRYAEVLLTAAEALNEISGPTSEAQGYVNEVRARARNWAGTLTDFPADVNAGISKDEFRDLVLEERRLELAFEFKRWFDIKRRQLGDKVFKGPNSLEPHENFDASKDYLFPLPQRELDNYPSFGPQNPGY
jgi:hypothetical protein